MKPGFGLLILIGALLPAISPAQTPGSVNAGGGSRGSATIQVRDVLGLPVAGISAGGTVVAATGTIPGLPAVTPVDLTAFALEVTGAGVQLSWEGNADRRILGFVLEKAAGPEPAPADYTVLDARFDGAGPHTYLDAEVQSGHTYYYRIRALGFSGEQETFGPWSIVLEALPQVFRPLVLPASPNPFREAFSLSLTLAEPTPVAWTLHDVRGRLVGGEDLGTMSAGLHSRTLRPEVPLPGGVYFLNVVAGGVRDVQKVVSLP